MRITRKQLKTFNRMNKKLKTAPLFFITNYGYLIRKYSYLKKSHFIVKCQLKFKKEKVVILFNQLKKLGVKGKEEKEKKKQYSKKLQKKCHTKIVHITGSPKKPKQETEARVISNAITVHDGGESVSTTNNKPIQEKVAVISETKTPVQPIKKPQPTQNEKELKSAEPKTNSDDGVKDVLPTSENVNDQIREQLKLLQSGRRSSISLLANNGNITRPNSVGTKTSSCCSTPSFSRHTSYSSLENEPIKTVGEKSTKADGVTASSQSQFNQKPKFIDSLISKLKTQGLNLPPTINDDSQSLSACTSPEKSIEKSPEKSTVNPQLKSPIPCESSMDVPKDDDQLSDHSTSSTDGFLGFQEIEAQFERPYIPGMLPTPAVKKSKGVKSAFVSEELDNFMKENALDNSSYTTAPLKKRHDEAMMYAEAEPPSLLCPQLPSDVEKPRTVAEKRQLLEKKADIKYLMIENESTVYRELRKRSKTGPVPNTTLIRNIQQMNIPFTRDCWRATCWLNTPNGRFYYQTIRDNGNDIKVLGGRGNNSVKELLKLEPKSKKKFIRQDCSKSCKLIGNIKINGLDELMTESTKQHSSTSEVTFTSKKLNTLSDSYSFQKPGPLSLKKLNPIKSSMDVELGPLELYNLPRIQLQVWPKVDRPLPEAVHPYLKLALPFQKITPEWAEFALSTLKVTTPPSRRKRKRTSEKKECNRSFTFNIPYANNQNRILVRKRRQIMPSVTRLNSITESEKIPLSFMENVDKTDDVAVAVADVLTDMINSVALTFCEATVIKDDPDIDYDKVDTQVDSGDSKQIGLNAVDGKKKNTPGGKIVKELKKLNAKIIHGFDTVKMEECKNAFCELGCVCDSLRGAQTYSYHCKEVNCMFECKCPSSKINTSTFESAVHNSDIKQFCDRMNASLAKEEKDFTATVVVSDGKTIYVPTWDEKKKRNKKVPKRMSDYVQFESEFVHRDLSETLITKEEKRMREKMDNVVDFEEKALMTNKNDIVKNMVHVNVNLDRLNALDSLQPWCMVHCLYKCFCKFRAVDGHRFEFGNTKIDIIEPTYTKKRQYTFERSKDEPASKMIKSPKYYNAPYPTEDDDYSSCRRVRVVATNQYKIVNRARSEDIRRRVKKMEKDNPGLTVLLKNRVKRSEALADVGPMVTINDSPRDFNQSAAPIENRSIAEKSQFGPSTSSFKATEKVVNSVEKAASGSLRVNESFDLTDYPPIYRSRFNNIIMKTMRRISNELRTTATLPNPVHKQFYYIQWKHFLEAFNDDRIFIWEVQLNNRNVLLVVTNENIMPIISSAMYVINIKAVSMERLPLLPKLIKLGVVNEETEKLSILLRSINNYWRVLGCTHSENDFLNERVVAVPTPDDNPALATKIAHLFKDLVQVTLKNRESKEPLKTTSNICIRQFDNVDINKIHVPIPVVGCHRWLMLSLADDFSHIYLPALKKFLSLEDIKRSIDHANKSQKTVRMGLTRRKPDVYVPHNSDMKIFVGPLQKNESIAVQLLQESGDKMMLREDYQRITNTKPSAVTTGTWLYMKDDHMLTGGSSPENIDESNCETNATSDQPARETLPPKLKVYTKPLQSMQGFIPLKPSTVTSGSSNLNITLMSPTPSSSSNCTTSTPITSSSIPSSELIRQLSLGLRARPKTVESNVVPTTNSSRITTNSSRLTTNSSRITTVPAVIPSKVSSKPADDSTTKPTAPVKPGLISVKDPSLLLSPQFNPSSSNSWAPSTNTSTVAKPVTMSFANSRGVSITTRRYTTFVPRSSKPMLKSILQKSIEPVESGKNNEAVGLAASLPFSASAASQCVPNDIPKGVCKGAPIRERRYTTMVNFALKHDASNKLTLARIPATDSSPQLIVNRPVLFKKVDAANSVAPPTLLRQRSKTIDRPKFIQISPTTKNKTYVKRNISSVAVKPSTAPIVVVKPSSFNLNLPPKMPPATIHSEGKSPLPAKLTATTFRLLPPKVKLSALGIKNAKKIPTNVDKIEIIDCDDEMKPLNKQQTFIHSLASSSASSANYPINGYFISEIRGLGKIMAKKLVNAYSLHFLGGSKLFQTLKHCIDHLNNKYIKERVFALVPAHLNIEWRFVVNEEDHASYDLHSEKVLRTSVVLTKDGIIDLNSDFDSNESYTMDLRHHLLVLRLANACMKNSEARQKTGLEIVKKSEMVIKELIAENKKLDAAKRGLQIGKDLNTLKLNELNKKIRNANDKSSAPMQILFEEKDDVITLDSD